MSQDPSQNEFDTSLVLAKSHTASTDSITVKPGVRFPLKLSVEGAHTDGMGSLRIDAALEWNEGRRAYSLTDLAIHASIRDEITAVLLKKIPVKVIRELVIRNAMPTDFYSVAGRRDKDEYLNLVTGRLTDELLREVALRAAVRHGLYGDPNREVMECFDVPQRTASHWIAKARERGFLD